MHRPAGGAQTRALACRVTAEDIDTMLDAYDSGMCDTTTANCLSQCLARRLRRDTPVRLDRHHATSATLHIDHHRVPVPPDLLAWLSLAETGARSGPVDFVLEVPVDVATECEFPPTLLPLPLRP